MLRTTLFILASIFIFRANPLAAQAGGMDMRPRKHNLGTTLGANLFGHLNLAYDIRLAPKHALGLDAMYAPRFVWFSPRYEESIWTLREWQYGRGHRLRFRYKIYPFQDSKRGHSWLYFSLQMVGRDVRHKGIVWRERTDLPLASSGDSVLVNVKRQALMWDLAVGMDIPIRRVVIGWFIGWSRGRQRSEARLVDGGPVPAWKNVDYPKAVGYPRLGVTIGYAWGKIVERK